jgi:UDP-GlcNAc:undecaprenyl-phosphate/decaprenyl-phosphate GlcNAc-1-phosphate transferase
MNLFLWAYLGAALLAVVLTPGVIGLARRIGAVDRPGLRGVHERPVPRMGGVAIFLSASSAIVLLLFVKDAAARLSSSFDPEALDGSKSGAASYQMQWQLVLLLCSSALVFLVGLVDDLRHLPAGFKLAAEVGIAGLLCLGGVRISSIALTDQWVVHLGGWGCLLTILWIVGVTNAVNLSDGLDGLAAGICAIACGVIAIFAIHSGQILMVLVMLALLGSLSGFLIFNFNPARVFMGDSGSLFLGFTIGACSVMCVAKSAALVGLTLPALALGIPIFDTLLSALRRFLEGRSIFAPDRGHFHHRLLDLGLHHRHAVILIYLATLGAAGLGLLMLMRKDLGALVIFAGVLFLILLLFRAVGALHVRQIVARLQQKYACSRQARAEQQTFERLQLGVRAVRTPSQRWQAVCAAAEQLELAWVSLQVTQANGDMETSIWRRQNTPVGLGSPTRNLALGGPFARLMVMSLPLNTAGRKAVELEIAVLVNGSLQSANHRAGLFMRLAEECLEIPNPLVRAGDPIAPRRPVVL